MCFSDKRPGSRFFRHFAAAGVLGIGGWLVIESQLALGQLVAAQLLVTQMLPAIERLIRHLQTLYELLSALGKIGYLEDLPLERTGGNDCVATGSGASINIQGLHVDYGQKNNVIDGLNLQLSAGERISLMGPNASGKSTLAFVLSGLIEPSSGLVQINGMDVRDIKYDSLRSIVSLVTDANEIFEGTIETNVTFGRNEITHADMLWALKLVDFDEELVGMRDGLKTQLLSGEEIYLADKHKNS